MPSILDKSFKYVPAASSDIRKTIQRELRRLAEQQKPQGLEPDKVLRFKTRLRKA